MDVGLCVRLHAHRPDGSESGLGSSKRRLPPASFTRQVHCFACLEIDLSSHSSAMDLQQLNISAAVRTREAL